MNNFNTLTKLNEKLNHREQLTTINNLLNPHARESRHKSLLNVTKFITQLILYREYIKHRDFDYIFKVIFFTPRFMNMRRNFRYGTD